LLDSLTNISTDFIVCSRWLVVTKVNKSETNVM
jgi:hypothetical protein